MLPRDAAAGYRSSWASVLVVVDDQALRLTLARILAAEGYAVEAAGDGADGLARARRWPPAVVLLDLSRAALDGYVFLDAFRRLPSCAAVPVMLLAVSADLSAARQRTVTDPAVVLVAKPFDLDALLEAIAAGVLRGGRPG